VPMRSYYRCTCWTTRSAPLVNINRGAARDLVKSLRALNSVIVAGMSNCSPV
jgi:hypothetical protein